MHKRIAATAVRTTSHATRFRYSSGLVTLLLIALVAVVALMLFTAAPVLTH